MYTAFLTFAVGLILGLFQGGYLGGRSLPLQGIFVAGFLCFLWFVISDILSAKQHHRRYLALCAVLGVVTYVAVAYGHVAYAHYPEVIQFFRQTLS